MSRFALLESRFPELVLRLTLPFAYSTFSLDQPASDMSRSTLLQFLSISEFGQFSSSLFSFPSFAPSQLTSRRVELLSLALFTPVSRTSSPTP